MINILKILNSNSWIVISCQQTNSKNITKLSRFFWSAEFAEIGIIREIFGNCP